MRDLRNLQVLRGSRIKLLDVYNADANKKKFHTINGPSAFVRIKADGAENGK